MAKREDLSAENISSASSDEEFNTVGYISIKDYAYDESNPLHYGYFDESSCAGAGLPHDDSDEGDEYGGGEGAYHSYYYYGRGLGPRGRSDEEDAIEKRQSIVMPGEYVVNKHAVALYDFVPENDNELELREGSIVYISYKHGQGWLVAEDSARTKTGLVPEEYVSILEEEDEPDVVAGGRADDEQARPFYLTQMLTQSMKAAAARQSAAEDEWEDIEGDEDEAESAHEDEAGAAGESEVDTVRQSMSDKLAL
ncbi:AaceriAGL169Cp [[Ashbya] aceris (nom. inval.)]|nr:AaceriAGL169Cp [[Ashbya] aceris (nom. inval.)]